MAENKDRNGNVNTYTICLWEKEYPDSMNENDVPDRNAVVVNIKDPALQTRPDALKLMTMSLDVEMPDDMEYIDNASPYWIILKESDAFSDYFKRLIKNAVDNYTSKSDMFGCCSKYTDCSIAGKCIHENLLYSKACSYRKNLEAGNIYYGSNE